MKFYWGRALNNQNQEFFFIDFVSCCTSFRPLLYGWSGCSRRGLSPSVRFFGPSESLGDFPQSSWWLFFRFWESWKSFFGVNKSPVLLFVTSRRFVSVRVSNGSLLKALLGFWKDKVFNLCVSCVLCSRGLCAFFFFFFSLGWKLLLFELENLRVVCVLCCYNKRKLKKTGWMFGCEE
jgi:hypothetical protein